MEEDIVDIASSNEGDNLYDQATQAGWQVDITPILTHAVSENQILFCSCWVLPTDKFLD
jgi:hypothetical protein